MIEPTDMFPYIQQSNLIENINSRAEDRRSALAWNWLMDQPAISLPVLFELHDRITKKQLPKSERGAFRKIQVYIGNHTPPPPEIAKYQATDWLWDLLEHGMELDPKEMHIRFETIHPFVDGNGRTGRMLMWWHEVQLGRVPTFISFDHRREYYSWFTEARNGN